MADQNRPHFRIAPKNVRQEKIPPHAFGSTFKRENYGEHGQKLISRFSEVQQVISKAKDSDLVDSIFLEVTTPESNPIRHESQKLSQLGLHVVSYSKRAENIGTAKVSRREYQKLQERIEAYASSPNNVGKSSISILEDISPVPIEEKISPNFIEVKPDSKIQSILYFYAGLSEREKTGIIDQIRIFLSDRDAEILNTYTFSTEDTTVVVSSLYHTLLELGEDFSTLRQIGPDRVFFTTDSTPTSPLPNPIAINPPINTVIVAVVDTGIRATSALISPAISSCLSFLPPNSVDAHYEHGTFVASRILYGDTLEDKLQNQPVTPSCYVLDVRVLGRDANGDILGLDEQGLAMAIDQAAQTFSPNVRVVNISLGTGVAINDNEYSLVANIIDQIARRYDLLFVTTAGNICNSNLIASYPRSVPYPGWRIDLPGESLLALTVGSIACFTDHNSISKKNELSPFSRIGPGANGGIKPEVVAHGGNCNTLGKTTSRLGVIGVHGDGLQIAFDFGTSFAAPLVSGIAAQIFEHYGAPSANLVKAFICHFTDPAISPINITDPLRTVGFGIPNLSKAISSGGSSAAFFHEGTIKKNVFQYIPFYVPNAMASGNNKPKLRIKGD